MKTRCLIVLIFSLVLSLPALANEREQEIQSILAVYEGGDLVAQKKQVEYLQWAGIVDERVYDAIERQLLDVYQDLNRDRDRTDAASWFVKGLAYSGNPKYVATLEKVKKETENRKLQKYVDEALVYLPKYQSWNSLINDRSHWDAAKNGVVNRYTNMIRSDVLRLKELAAKRIYNERVFDADLLEIVHQDLMTHYQDDDSSRDFGTTYATMAKTLVTADKARYSNVIFTVAEGAKNNRLKKLTTRYIRDYDLK